MPILFLPSVLFLPCLSNYFEICFVQDILIIKKYVIADNYSDGHKKIPHRWRIVEIEFMPI